MARKGRGAVLVDVPFDHGGHPLLHSFAPIPTTYAAAVPTAVHSPYAPAYARPVQQVAPTSFVVPAAPPRMHGVVLGAAGTGSYVPPVVVGPHGVGSYVPPVAVHGVGSYVPPVGVHGVGSYVPPVGVHGVGSYVPPIPIGARGVGSYVPPVAAHPAAMSSFAPPVGHVVMAQPPMYGAPAMAPAGPPARMQLVGHGGVGSYVPPVVQGAAGVGSMQLPVYGAPPAGVGSFAPPGPAQRPGSHVMMAVAHDGRIVPMQQPSMQASFGPAPNYNFFQPEGQPNLVRPQRDFSVDESDEDEESPPVTRRQLKPQPQPVRTGPSLLHGFPDPGRISQQKDNYSQSLDDQLDMGVKELEKHNQQRKLQLYQAADAQKAQLALQVDQQMKMQESALDEQTSHALMGLKKSALDQRAHLEQQAHGMMLEYQTRKMQEEYHATQAEMHRQYQSSHAQIQQEVTKLGPNVQPRMIPVGAVPANPHQMLAPGQRSMMVAPAPGAGSMMVAPAPGTFAMPHPASVMVAPQMAGPMMVHR